MGAGGIYFRQTLSPDNLQTPVEVPQSSVENIEFKPIESGDINLMIDSSSAALLDEINGKAKKVQIWPWILTLSVCAIVLLAVLDSPVWAWCLTGPALIGGIVWAVYADKLRKTVVLFYSLEPQVEDVYQRLHDAFNILRGCSRIWHVEAKGDITSTYDWKINSGASAIVRRKGITPDFASPPYFQCNISIPVLPAKGRRLYFFPDRILVWSSGVFGAVDYKDLEFEIGERRFIESDGVPLDARVVDKTWRYVNKKGGPDRRFNNNSEIPVVLYEELLFASHSGLREQFQLSRTGIAVHLDRSLRNIATIIAPKAVPPVITADPPIIIPVARPIRVTLPISTINVVPRTKPPLQWHGPGESINLLGFELPSPMVYVSDGEPSKIEASAINTKLRVRNAEMGDSIPLFYSPHYSNISPDQRAAYLKWLAGGRKDVDPATREIGYVFLFLYGLERRLLVDHGQEQEVVAEVVRLLEHYRSHVRGRSLHSYGGQLVHFWGWMQGPSYYLRLLEWMKTLPVSLLGSDELSMVLAGRYQSNAPLSAEYAFEVAARDPGSRRSVIVSRVQDEFKALFTKRYLEKFPTGIELKAAKLETRLHYRPANPSLLYSERLDFSIKIPDVLGIPSQFKHLPVIWNSCVEDLAGYSRAKAKSNLASSELKAYLVLPEELRQNASHPLEKEWAGLLANAREGKDCQFLDVGSVARLLDFPQRETLTPGQSNGVAEAIESLGFVVEPDARHESVYAWDQEVAVFRPANGKVSSPSSSYLGAAVLLKLCVLVAGADGHIAPEELAVSRRFVETKLVLAPEDHSRLMALEQILVADPNRISSSLSRIAKPIPAAMRSLICEVLVYVAAADSIITKEEIRVLERIFRAFELSRESLETYLASVAPSFKEVQIQTVGNRVPGEMIPKQNSQFQINMSRVDRIAQETSEVVTILARAMADDEPEKSADLLESNSPAVSSPIMSSLSTTLVPAALQERMESLQPKYRPVLLRLLEQSSWTRTEFESVVKKAQLMPLDAFDGINGWSDETLGDFLLEGEETIVIHKQLLP